MPQCDHIAETEPAVTGAPDAAARAEMRAKRVEDALAAGLSHTVSLTLGYEGSGFAGYARQAETHIKTVQGELESVLSMLYKRDVPIVCAGRTDAGVHARGQVVSFDVSEDEFQSRSFRGLQRSLNALVDEAISISSIDERPLGFSARFDALWREYHYHICTNTARPVLIAPIAWHLGGATLDVDAMNEACSHLIGEHDFKSFCTAKPEVTNTVRTVYSLDLKREDDMITLRIRGNGFLYNMVRIITGTLIRVGGGFLEPEDIPKILEAKDRGAAGETARPEGLTLVKIEYV